MNTQHCKVNCDGTQRSRFLVFWCTDTRWSHSKSRLCLDISREVQRSSSTIIRSCWTLAAGRCSGKGDAMMAKWAEVMTNIKPKTYFLQPHVAIPLAIAVVREFIDQKILWKPSSYVNVKNGSAWCAAVLRMCSFFQLLVSFVSSIFITLFNSDNSFSSIGVTSSRC